MPQVIVNKQKWKKAIEGLELSRELAKQVLSGLTYTPRCTVSVSRYRLGTTKRGERTLLVP